MPIYEYRCNCCERSFEKLVRLNTPTEEIECPYCEARECERLLSLFSSSSAGDGSSGGSFGSSSGCGGSGFS